MRNPRTDYLGAHILSLLAGEGWCQAARDDVDEHWLRCKGSDGRLKELLSLDTLNEANIRASVRRELETGDGLLHAEHLCGVRPRNDDLIEP